MYGPKPPAARRLAHPLADGGLVARMKSADAGPAAFGSRGLSQLRDLIPKMEAMGYKQQPQSFAKGGMIRGPGTGTSDSIPDEMAPGTYILPADTTAQLGLSDKKVPVRVSNGEYELPPEQVQAVGAAVLDAIKGVTHTPKSLSARGLKAANGEEQAFSGGGQVRREEGGGLSKEAVMAAIAKQAAQQQPAQPAQQPAARGLSGLATDFLRNPGGILAQRERQAGGYADGGVVDEEQQRLANQTAMYVRGAQEAAATAPAPTAASVPAPAAPAAKDPLDGGAAFGFYPQLAGGKRTSYAMDEKLRTGVQATGPSTFAPATPTDKTIIGGGNGQRMNATQDPRSLIAATAAPAPAAVAPATPSAAGGGRGMVNPSAAPPSAVTPNAGPQVANTPTAPSAAAPTPGNVTRVGNTYSGTNVTGDITVNGQAPRGGFMVADGARGFSPGAPATAAPQGVTAPTVRHSGNDWQSRNDLRNAMVSATSIMNDGGKWDKHGKGVVSPERAYAAQLAGTDAQLRGAQPSVDVAAMRENAGIQHEGMQQTGATTRTGMTEQGANAREQGRNALQRDEFNLRREASGFQTRAAQQQEQLRNVLLDPKATPEQRAVAQRNLAAMMGKGEENRFTVVPGGQEWDQAAGAMRNVPARVLNNQTGRFVEQAQGGAGGAQPLPNHVAALRANPGQAAQFDDIYGPGAAARALGR